MPWRKSWTVRFLEKFVVNPETECWEWIGSLQPSGYSQLNVPTGPGEWFIWLGHRLSYLIFKGPIPEGLIINHKCRVRHCVNPDHLEAITDHQNILLGTGYSARNRRKTHCPKGHPYSIENTYYRRDPKGRISRRCLICIRS